LPEIGDFAWHFSRWTMLSACGCNVSSWLQADVLTGVLERPLMIAGLRDDSNRLAAARGIMIGTVLGIIIWAVIFWVLP
jgi:hypothetical protein